MKRYCVDTNFYLRWILQDHPEYVDQVEKYLTQAKAGQIALFFADEVILETSYVLLSVYSIPRDKVLEQLLVLVKTEYLDIENRSLWKKTLELAINTTLDILDLLLLVKAQENGYELLTFDKKLQVLALR